jgi:hypothetical protein
LAASLRLPIPEPEERWSRTPIWAFLKAALPSRDELIFHAPLVCRKSAAHNTLGQFGRFPALPVFRTLPFVPISDIY